MKVLQPIKRIALVLGVSLLVLIAATGISLLGIELSGGVTEWRQWLADHTEAFRLWRISVYIAIVIAWYRLRYQQALNESTHHRLLGIEFNFVILIALLELLAFLLHR